MLSYNFWNFLTDSPHLPDTLRVHSAERDGVRFESGGVLVEGGGADGTKESGGENIGGDATVYGRCEEEAGDHDEGEGVGGAPVGLLIFGLILLAFSVVSEEFCLQFL